MEFRFETEISELDVDQIYEFLTNSYWSPGITQEKVNENISASFNYALFDGDDQVAYARVSINKENVAYIADLFVIESFRGKVLSKRLLDHILKDESLKNINMWTLKTKDATSLYERYGYKTDSIKNGSNFMKMSRVSSAHGFG